MNDLTVTMHMPPDLAGELTKHSGMLAFVKEAFPTIDSPDIADLAAAERKQCIAVAKAIKEKMDQYTAPAEQIIEQARADFRPAIDNANSAAIWLGSRLLEWDAKEKRRIEALRLAKEEEDRKLRAKAAADAEAVRAKAEAEAREQRRRADEAAAAERKALEEGNAKAAAKAAAEAAKLQEKAKASDEQALIDAENIRMQAESQIQAGAVVAAEKTSGFSTRKNWKGELPPGTTEKQAILAIIAVIETHPEYVSYLTLEWKAIHASAKALEANFNVPGLRARNIPVGVSR